MVEPDLIDKRALKICDILVKHKGLLTDKNYEMQKIYNTQILKHRLLTHYDLFCKSFV